jgi:hypothetical protein
LVFRQDRNIGHNWQFTYEQERRLDQYTVMQAVKPEWTMLHSELISLDLDERIEQIITALKLIPAEVNPDLLRRESSLVGLLRRIQRYVEWTVPELLPDRAEAAEQLVNIARLAAQLLVQPDAGNRWSTAVAEEFTLITRSKTQLALQQSAQLQI